jgi:hypothetical protein
MTLIYHKSRVSDRLIPAKLGFHHGAENPEKLMRMKAAGSHIVVRITPIIKVKPAETPLPDYLSHYLLDVHPVSVMAEVYQHKRPISKHPANVHAPRVILDSGRI